MATPFLLYRTLGRTVKHGTNLGYTADPCLSEAYVVNFGASRLLTSLPRLCQERIVPKCPQNRVNGQECPKLQFILFVNNCGRSQPWPLCSNYCPASKLAASKMVNTSTCASWRVPGKWSDKATLPAVSQSVLSPRGYPREQSRSSLPLIESYILRA